MARFYPIEEVVQSLCLRSGDILMRNKGLYLDCAEEVYNDLNEDVLKFAERVKMPVRYSFCVDKKTNSIILPKKYLHISSIHAIDKWGCYYPIYRNDHNSDEIIDVAATRNCDCDTCTSNLCNTMKGYEAVHSTKSDYLPNGEAISFQATDRKIVDDQGFVYEQTQYPLRQYLSGVWTDTILHTETKTLCKVDVDEHGCICDTEANLSILCTACNVHDSFIVYGGTSINPPICEPDACEWIYHCASRMEFFNIQCGCYPYRCGGNNLSNVYNISVSGDRITFPYTFGWDKVMIRFYEDINLRDLQIPYMAKSTFMTGLQYFATCHHDKKQNLAAVYDRKYSRQKWGLFLELNKHRLGDIKDIFTPQAYMPSYFNNPWT